MRGVSFATRMVRKVGENPVDKFPPAGQGKSQTRRNPSNRAYKVGELLYVKEAWVETPDGILYWADVENDPDVLAQIKAGTFRRKFGRFMPERLARYCIVILKAEPQWLTDITEADALAEGFTSRAEFLDYFYKLNPKSERNTPVIVYTFMRTETDAKK